MLLRISISQNDLVVIQNYRSVPLLQNRELRLEVHFCQAGGWVEKVVPLKVVSISVNQRSLCICHIEERAQAYV